MFPDVVIDVLARHMKLLDGVGHVVERSLTTTDESLTAGIDAEGWYPVENEMSIGSFAPTIARYTVSIQHMVVHSDEEEGLRIHRKCSNDIRDMIYHDAAFTTELRQLSATNQNRMERIIRYSVSGQEFASNSISGSFVSMSVTTVAFETETIAS